MGHHSALSLIISFPLHPRKLSLSLYLTSNLKLYFRRIAHFLGGVLSEIFQSHPFVLRSSYSCTMSRHCIYDLMVFK
jgi:hypothetical protein